MRTAIDLRFSHVEINAVMRASKRKVLFFGVKIRLYSIYGLFGDAGPAKRRASETLKFKVNGVGDEGGGH